MPEQPREPRADLDDWEVESLRLTIFPSPRPYVIEKSWWEELIGDSPESTTTRPKEGVTQEDGLGLGGKLALITQPTRVDWVLSGNEPLSSIGTPKEAFDAFVPPLKIWLLEKAPPMQRLAFGSVFRLPVEDAVKGFRRLSSYLHSLQIDAEGTRDFVYQINRSRVSRTGIEGVRINRLAKWTVGFLQSAILSVGQDQASFQKPEFHCRLELDLNTHQDYKSELNSEQGQMILEELIDLALEIVQEGDVP
jgi:hypothetical protein